MVSKILLLFLPSLALASIQIYVTGDYKESEESLNVHYKGNSTEIISDRDMKTFSLNSSALFNAIEKYTEKRPTNVYLKSPTVPFGDLYSTYRWKQVQRTLRPIRAVMTEVISEPELMLKENFENNSTKDGYFNVNIFRKAKDTARSYWFMKDDIHFDAKAKYNFNVAFSEGSASTDFTYNAVWGEDYVTSNTVTIGSTSGLQFLLKPGQTVVSVLMATKTTVKVEVQYDATLSGALAVNYEEPYKGHHFWSMDINAVCNAGGLSNKVVAQEEIELEYYWNSSIKVYDGLSQNKVLLEVKL